jgi:hypothetical protein
VLNSWKSIALPGLGLTPDSNLSIICGGMSSVLGGAVMDLHTCEGTIVIPKLQCLVL